MGGDGDASRRSFLSVLIGASVGATSGCIGGERHREDTQGGAPVVGATGVPGAVVPSTAWNRRTDGEVISSPAVAGGRLFCGSHDGHVYGYAGDEGVEGQDGGSYPMFNYDLANTNAVPGQGPTGDVAELWRFPTEGRVMATPAVADGRVFVGSEDERFYAIDAGSGEELWRRDVGEVIGGGSATVADGTVFFSSGFTRGDSLVGAGDSGGTVHAVDAATGDDVWRSERSEGIQSPPAVDDDVLYHGCQDGNVYALDTATGDEVWRFEGADEKFCGNMPAVSDGRVYAGCEDGSVYALDADDGRMAWAFETGGMVVSSAAVAEGKVFFVSGDQNLYAVDAATGEELWRFEMGDDSFSSPGYRDGVVYVGSADEHLYAVDAATGEMIWFYGTEGTVASSPVVTGEAIYVGSSDRHVYAVTTEPTDEATRGAYREAIERRKQAIQEERYDPEEREAEIRSTYEL